MSLYCYLFEKAIDQSPLHPYFSRSHFFVFNSSPSSTARRSQDTPPLSLPLRHPPLPNHRQAARVSPHLIADRAGGRAVRGQVLPSLRLCRHKGRFNMLIENISISKFISNLRKLFVVASSSRNTFANEITLYGIK